jgi:3-isopropylmalate dehydrogenase
MQATGLNIANPLATILSAVMFEDAFGLHEEAATIEQQ